MNIDNCKYNDEFECFVAFNSETLIFFFICLLARIKSNKKYPFTV